MKKDRKKSSTKIESSKIVVITPIVVSVLSLLFGGYQYLEKRQYEKKLLELEISEKESNKRLIDMETLLQEKNNKIADYEILEKERNQAAISVDYIETDIVSIIRTGGLEMTGWLRFLKNKLPFEVNLRLQETVLYSEIQKFNLSDNNLHIDVNSRRLTFLLIRNTGNSEAMEIYITFLASSDKFDSLRIDRLDPKSGVMLLIEQFDAESGEYFDSRMIPDSKLTYFDGYLNEYRISNIRSKNSSATIISPTIRLGF